MCIRDSAGTYGRFAPPKVRGAASSSPSRARRRLRGRHRPVPRPARRRRSPRRPATAADGEGLRPTPAVAQVDAAHEGDVELGTGWMTQHHELLVVRTSRTYPHVQQALTPGLLDLLAEVPILRGAEAELVEVGAPNQPTYVDAAASRLTQRLRHRAVGLSGEELVGIAAPVGEQHQVAPPELRQASDQLGEV